MRKLVMMLAVTAGVTAGAISADAKTVNPPKMTCAEFLALSDKIQPRAVAWLDGYSAAGKLKEQEIGDVDVDRQTDTLVVVCQQDPKVTFWDKVKAHMPGGSKKIKPTKMTCDEFVAMDDTVKPEAVFWSEGYNAGVKKEDVTQVDLERDINVVVVDCKQAPKESFWTKVKNFFHHGK